MIERQLFEELKKRMFSGKAIVINGPRQVGKTTLINELLNNQNQNVLFLDGDDQKIRELLSEPLESQIAQIIGNNKIVFIDEAQRIQNIGLTGKIITDQFKNVQLILSGSSSFELSEYIQEPLTGRKWQYNLYPISWKEFEKHFGYLEAEKRIDNQLVFGFYPDIINHPQDQKEILHQLVDSYLYKDILAYDGLRKPQIIQKLTRALAYQVGQEIRYSELSKLVGVDTKTIERYIDILEKAYVVFRLPAFSRNLRNEIKKSKKIYFYDNGVRNAVINSLEPFSVRNDRGHLWENFLVSERVKQNAYKRNFGELYFWRTKQQQEIDLIEEIDNELKVFEFKLNPQAKASLSKTFISNYKPSHSAIINRSNFREFVQ
ncbi:ATP-binding protein [Salibacter sp.]|uniref:ATP-binding protein n=1 Tax=Salibacter sp. TaxID=2010995 RepID=UPI0028700298|nr:ATP-binding protein [Salibacter sp.]MDR9487296.1 ATP-binding protein [Salibacter sp.]